MNQHNCGMLVLGKEETMILTLYTYVMATDYIPIDASIAVKSDRTGETLFEGEFAEIPTHLLHSKLIHFNFANGEDADTTYIAYIYTKEVTQ